MLQLLPQPEKSLSVCVPEKKTLYLKVFLTAEEAAAMASDLAKISHTCIYLPFARGHHDMEPLRGIPGPLG